MLTFYTIPESLYCAKTRILLRYKNLEWEEMPPPGGYGSDEYKTYIPSGNLPALIDNNLILADSEAIAEYLEEKNPNPSALPNDIIIRAKIRELSRFHDTRLEPVLRKLFAIFSDVSLSEIEFKQITQQLSISLDQLDKILEEYLPIRPAHLCLADCGFAITFLWLEQLCPYLNIDITFGQNTQRYKTKIEALIPIKKELQSYKPILKSFLAEELDQA